ncbi:putative aluminium activated malate transporter [Lyophyllum shimeji]|uniref:Aluminium activated malate transporter n=1 Tax=Lyophyllum shimeji TaxID=47721 RepID=A0A9P3PKH0_LYOSH|nr:putative aluminium activated malate transporter [Lyophyllum shimeji]
MSTDDEESPGSRTPTRQTASSTIRIPQRHDLEQRIRSGTASSSSFLVGSPDQFTGEYQTPPRATHNILGESSPTARSRPTAGNRSTSTPVINRRRLSSSSHRVVSGLANIGPGATEPGHQWTVFGQLMENEGQLPTPATPLKHSSGQGIQRMGHYATVGADHDFSGLRRSEPDPFLDRGSLTEEDTRGDKRRSSRAPSIQGASMAVREYDTSESYPGSDSEDFTSPMAPEPSHERWCSFRRLPHVPVLYRNVLKCSIAYLLASLFTFNPVLASTLSKIASDGPGPHRPFQSGHIVASIVAYFNPAKTIGGMIEADIFCLVGFLFSAFVCLSSMGMFWWLESQPGWEWLGDVIVVLWVGISLGVVAWLKVWMANPSFNTACSMITIIIVVVVVKEGGYRTLLAVTTIVVYGILATNLVCFLIWPQSATKNLQKNMVKTLDSFSTVLSMLTNTFLLEGGVHKQCHLEKMQRAVEDHQDSFTSLQRSLTETRTEWFLRGDPPGARAEERGKRAYEDAVDSLNRLGQHLNGLRSGTRLQYELTKAGVDGLINKRGKTANNGATPELGAVTQHDEETAMLKAAAAMFGDLVDDLGPPLKALSNACTNALKRMREAFEESQTKQPRDNAFSADEFQELVDGIQRALVRFESTSNHAVLRLYRKSDVLATPRSSSPSHHTRTSAYTERGNEADNSLLTGSDHENIFLVYFFIFTLQEYAREMVSLIDAMGRIYRYEHDRAHRGQWWKRLYQGPARFFARLTFRRSPDRAPGTPKRRHRGLKRTLSAYIISDIRHPVPVFPKVRPHAPNTIQTPAHDKLSFVGRVKHTIWRFGRRMTESDMKYAFKVSVAIAMFTAPAFYEGTRPFFLRWWGNWALVSFMAVISPTVGATNNLGFQRVIGTAFGALVAAGIFSLFADSPVILATFGFLFSLPCFYYAVAYPQYSSASRFVLLTYNLSCLYSYNLRDQNPSVVKIASGRALSVTAGVLWAAFVSRFWWPAEARRELGKSLAEFCLNIGWLYTRLVASNSFSPEYRPEGEGAGDDDDDDDDDSAAEGSPLFAAPSQSTRLNNSIKEFMAMELHLQIQLIELQNLLAQTAHEPRLKGPFPIMLYRGVLTGLQTILDKLHSMRCVTTREEWYTSVRHDFIIPVNKERREMVGNIILSLSTLAAAFRLKAPLPPYLPPVESSRQRLVDAIRRLDVVKNRDVKGSRQLLFFAYALAMKGVTEELESLGRTLQEAFGVIGETPEEFEALFMAPEESRRRIDYAA